MDIKYINQYNHLVVRLNMQQCLHLKKTLLRFSAKWLILSIKLGLLLSSEYWITITSEESEL